jgi:hypothetical protein
MSVKYAINTALSDVEFSLLNDLQSLSVGLIHNISISSNNLRHKTKGRSIYACMDAVVL